MTIDTDLIRDYLQLAVEKKFVAEEHSIVISQFLEVLEAYYQMASATKTLNNFTNIYNEFLAKKN